MLADRIRLLRNFGFAGLDNVISIGTNAKLNEISAAMGLTLLDDLDEITAANQKNYNLYGSLMANLPGISLVSYNPTEYNNYQYIILEIDPELAGLSRDLINDILWAENIRARRYFYPGVHRMEPYRSSLPAFSGQLPVTERLVHCLMALPNGTSIREHDIEATCNIIRFCLQNADEIKRRSSIQECHGKKSHPG
jgi:dTDP-4-amino-4,6-dideoxygalactose transaminase